jgi:hypothetical protein
MAASGVMVSGYSMGRDMFGGSFFCCDRDSAIRASYEYQLLLLRRGLPHISERHLGDKINFLSDFCGSYNARSKKS